MLPKKVSKRAPPAASGWCLWLEPWRRSILQTHGQSSHSSASEHQFKLGWAPLFGFGPHTKSQTSGVEMRVYPELKRRKASCPGSRDSVLSTTVKPIEEKY